MSAKTKKSAPAPAAGNPPVPVILRTQTASLPLMPGAERLLPQMAMKWSSMVANRERWDRSERDRQHVASLAVVDLEQLFGRTPAQLAEAFGQERLLEVSICWGDNESESWPARIMPWEYLITAATRAVRMGALLLIVRHLDRGPSTVPVSPGDGLILCSTPPVIGPELQKSLADETRIVGSAWEKLSVKVQALTNPEKAALKGALQAGADWIHFLGVNGSDLARGAMDSIVLGGEAAESFVVITADEIRECFAAASHKPSLAVFNFCNSAGRLAASAVAGGAGAAIGFQDLVSSQTCMDLVGAFYPALKRREGNLLEAFKDFWDASATSLRGTVIVLWSAHSLIPPLPAASPAAATPGTSQGAEASRAAVPEYRIPDVLEVFPEVVSAVNFSLLHNGSSLFKEFRIGKAGDPPMKDVLIEVTVNDGGQSSSWRALRTFPHSGFNIAGEVQLSFISGMVRSLRESLVTSLHIAISCGRRLLYSKSVPIKLLAIDEWVDDDDNRRWLPSFVLPRDPAVADIITRAEGYLQALCDDFGAGFDGYQSAPDILALQVRALWVALSRDCRIRYINPPPTYTQASQRLRRPGEILTTRQGTCLDLALLLSACLEWIGVYPVIFLINGHAFPGYWCCEEDYHAFYQAEKVEDGTARVLSIEQRQTTGGKGGERGWMTGEEGAASVLREVQSGRLVPIETVWLTNGRSFAEAVEAGRHNLYAPGAFEYLVDVQRARKIGRVTPLPLPDKL